METKNKKRFQSDQILTHTTPTYLPGVCIQCHTSSPYLIELGLACRVTHELQFLRIVRYLVQSSAAPCVEFSREQLVRTSFVRRVALVNDGPGMVLIYTERTCYRKGYISIRQDVELSSFFWFYLQIHIVVSVVYVTTTSLRCRNKIRH